MGTDGDSSDREDEKDGEIVYWEGAFYPLLPLLPPGRAERPCSKQRSQMENG